MTPRRTHGEEHPVPTAIPLFRCTPRPRWISPVHGDGTVVAVGTVPRAPGRFAGILVVCEARTSPLASLNQRGVRAGRLDGALAVAAACGRKRLRRAAASLSGMLPPRGPADVHLVLHHHGEADRAARPPDRATWPERRAKLAFCDEHAVRIGLTGPVVPGRAEVGRVARRGHRCVNARGPVSLVGDHRAAFAHGTRVECHARVERGASIVRGACFTGRALRSAVGGASAARDTERNGEGTVPSSET
jgi:hypothetical protein